MSEHEQHVLVARLAWTLIHFLWQGAVIAGLLHLALAVLRGRTSNQRYIVRCAALGLVALAPVVTFSMLGAETPSAVALPSTLLVTGETLVTGTWASWFTSGDLLPWVVLLWSLGAAFFSIRLAGGCWQVWRLRRRATGVDLAPRWQRRFEELAHDFGARARARVVECAAVSVPTVIGWVKPVVFLPARIFTGLTDEQIEALIAHELAHVARFDYLVNLVQSVLEALLFYHPAVWWISRGIRIEREYCCDDLAVAATHDGLSYAHALTALESWRSRQPQMGVSTLGGSLMQRIQRLVGVPQSKNPAPLRPVHALAALFVAGSVGASAFGLSALPERTPGDDCPCACHQNKKEHEHPQKQKTIEFVVPEVGYLSSADDLWTMKAPEPQESWRYIWQPSEEGVVQIGDELVEYKRLKGELAELREMVAQVRGEIHNLMSEAGGEAPKRKHLFHAEYVAPENLKKGMHNRFFVNRPQRIVEGHPGWKVLHGDEGEFEIEGDFEEGFGGYLKVETKLDPKQNIFYVNPRIRQRYVEGGEHEHGDYERSESEVDYFGDYRSPEAVKVYTKNLQEVTEQLKGLGELEGLRYRVLAPNVEQWVHSGDLEKLHEHLDAVKELHLPNVEYIDAEQLKKVYEGHLHEAQGAVEEAKKLQQYYIQRLNPDLPKGAHGVYEVDGDALIEGKELENLKSLRGLKGLKVLKEIDFENLEHGQVLHGEDLPEGVQLHLQDVLGNLHGVLENVEVEVEDLRQEDHDLLTEQAIQELIGKVEVDFTKKGADIELEVQDLVKQIKALVKELEQEEDDD